MREVLLYTCVKTHSEHFFRTEIPVRMSLHRIHVHVHVYHVTVPNLLCTALHTVKLSLTPLSPGLTLVLMSQSRPTQWLSMTTEQVQYWCLFRAVTVRYAGCIVFNTLSDYCCP